MIWKARFKIWGLQIIRVTQRNVGTWGETGLCLKPTSFFSYPALLCAPPPPHLLLWRRAAPGPPPRHKVVHIRCWPALTLGKPMQFLEQDLGPLEQGNPGSCVSRAWSRREGMSSGWPCPLTLWTPYLIGFFAAKGGLEYVLPLLRSKGNIRSGYSFP